jgi:hypothetical protein
MVLETRKIAGFRGDFFGHYGQLTKFWRLAINRRERHYSVLCVGVGACVLFVMLWTIKLGVETRNKGSRLVRWSV